MVEQLAIELPLLITVVAALIGATLNVLRGYLGDDSVESVIALNPEFLLLPETAGELLGIDDFETMIDSDM